MKKLSSLYHATLATVCAAIVLSSCGMPRNVVSILSAQSESSVESSIKGNNHLPTNYPIESIKFSHLTSQNGLSQSVITSILQDEYGYIWFGTEDGLNKFDGRNVAVYRNDPDDPDSISSNDISTMVQIPDGSIWIGTLGGGLSEYDRENGVFRQYQHSSTIKNSLTSDYICSLLYDPEGYLWIGTLGGGLNRYDLTNGNFQSFLYDSLADQSISANDVLSLQLGENNTLWVGTSYGLDRFDKISGTFSNFRSDSDIPVVVSRSSIFSLHLHQHQLMIGTEAGLFQLDIKDGTVQQIGLLSSDDSTSRIPIRSILLAGDGNYWVGTLDYGLFRIAQNLSRVERIQADPKGAATLSDNRILSLMEDSSGVIWVGTYSGFVNLINPLQNRFKSLEYTPWQENSISESMVWSLQPGQNNMLWIGTDGGGLNLYNLSSGENRVYRHNADNPDSIDDNHVRSLLYDQSGRLWVGTDSGISYFIEDEEKFIPIRLRPQSDQEDIKGRQLVSYTPIQVLALKQDDNGLLWIGTGNSGLYQYNPLTGAIEHFEYQPGYSVLLPSNTVWSLYPDLNNILWIATNRGLIRFDTQNYTSTTYLPSKTQRGSISEYRVLCLLRDQHHTLWMGTASGLNRFDDKTGSFTVYRMKDGLPNDFIYSIQEDEEGKLWLSTNKGLSRFDPETEEFRNYNTSAGISGEEFNQGAGAKDQSGQIYFGGIYGVTYFRPRDIYANSYLPEVFLTSLTQGGQPILDKLPLEIVTSVQLTWPKNYFEFSFQDQLAYTSKNKQYAYRLVPFETDWVYSGAQGQGRYTNLPGGEYTLWLRASDGEGNWYPEKKALQILIAPPLWENREFLTILGLAIIFIIAGIVYSRVQSTQRRTRELAQLVNIRTREIDQRRQVAEGLREILIRINSNLTIEDSLSFIANHIKTIMNVDEVVIAQCEQQKSKTCFRISASGGNKYNDHATVENIFRKLQTNNTTAALPGNHIRSFEIPDIKYHNITALPVVLDGNLEAALTLFSQAQKQWSTEEKELLATFSDQIALAMGNAKLRRNTAELAMLNERNRLARDLHDAVTQTLFSASLLAEAFPGVWDKNPEEGKKLIQEMRQLTRGALAEMRSLLMELRPTSMAEAKLSDLIRQLAEAVSGRTGLIIKQSVPTDLHLPSDVNITLYRIAQEALTNVVKHAKANNVSIICIQKTSRELAANGLIEIEMSIEDDGCGFETKLVAQDHFGLYNMQERADNIQGKLEIYSKPGAGTRISVSWKGKEAALDE